MANGYVKIYRTIRDWGWYADTPTRSVFLELLLTANWKPTRIRNLEVSPGQCVCSIPGLARTLGLSEKNVRTALAHLKSTGEVADKPAGWCRLVTVVNWAKYQEYLDEPAGQTAVYPAGKWQASGRQVAASEEGKKERKEEGKNSDDDKPIGLGETATPTLSSAVEAVEHPPPTLAAAPPKADHRNPDVQAVIEHLRSKLVEHELAADLDPSEATNRRAAWNLLRKLAKEYPKFPAVESAKRMIDFATADPFHQRNCTHVNYLHRNCGKIIIAARAAKRDARTATVADQHNLVAAELAKRAEQRAARTIPPA